MLADATSSGLARSATKCSTSRTRASASTILEQNTRSLDPSYGTRYIHSALEPFGLGNRWSFVNYDGSHHGLAPRPSARIARRGRPVHQSFGWIVVLARRVREIPRACLHRLRSGVHAARDCKRRAVVRGILPRVRSSVHVRRQHRNARIRRPGRRLRVAQDVAADSHRSVADRAPAAAPGSRP